MNDIEHKLLGLYSSDATIYEFDEWLTAEDEPGTEYQKPPKRWWQIRDRYTFQTQYYERKIRAFDVYADFFEIDLYYRDGLSKMLFKKNPY